MCAQILYIVVGQSLSHVWFFATPWSFPILHYLLEFSQIHVHWVCDAIQPSHPLLRRPLLFPPSILHNIRVFAGESALCNRWPKYQSFSISPSSKYSGLISFRIDWFDLLAIQRTLQSLLQHHNLKVSIICHSAFFMVQLVHLYMITRKTIALTIWTFVDRVMSLLFNTLSGFVMAFIPRSSHRAEVTMHSDFGAQEKKSYHCYYFFHLLFAMKKWDKMLWS